MFGISTKSGNKCLQVRIVDALMTTPLTAQGEEKSQSSSSPSPIKLATSTAKLYTESLHLSICTKILDVSDGAVKILTVDTFLSCVMHNWGGFGLFIL